MKIFISALFSFCMLYTVLGFAARDNSLDPFDSLDLPHKRIVAGINEKKCRYCVSACAIFQDEAPYLKEWIEYHRLIGVEHFYLYNNNSHDHYKEVLAPYIKKGIVELIDWPSPEDKDWTPYQVKAYNHCINISRGVTKWLAVIDLDEFIVLMDRKDLVSFLHDFDILPHVGGVWMFWLVFGTSGIKKIPEDKLLIESLIMRSHKNFGWHHQVKTICKPHTVAKYAVHGAVYKKGFMDVTETGFGGNGQNIEVNRIRLHHYWTRDIDFFLKVKVPRRERVQGKPYTKNEIKGFLKQFNQTKDRSIFRFVPMLRERVFGKSKHPIATTTTK